MQSWAIALAVAALTAPTLVVAQAYDPQHGGQQAPSSKFADPWPNRPDQQPDSGDSHTGGLRDGGPGGADHAQAAPYRHWTRGQVLPPEYRTAPITDYDSLHLRRPPRGYAWYHCGDEMVLAAVDSGMIFEVIDGD